MEFCHHKLIFICYEKTENVKEDVVNLKRDS